MSIWCLQYVKDFILTFSIGKKIEFANHDTFLFSLGGCFDEVVDNRTNYQGYKCVYQGYKCVHSFSITH